MSTANHKPYHDNIKTQILTQTTVPPIFTRMIFLCLRFPVHNSLDLLYFPRPTFQNTCIACVSFPLHPTTLTCQCRWRLLFFDGVGRGLLMVLLPWDCGGYRFFYEGRCALLRGMRRGWIQLGRLRCDYLDTGREVFRGGDFEFYRK